MAKVTDYAIVQQAIEAALDDGTWSIEELLGRELATLVVLNIYYTNDVCVGFGQDFHNKVSVISGRQRISVIVQSNSSMYKDDGPICRYDDLADDVNEILIVMQAAYDRIQFT